MNNRSLSLKIPKDVVSQKKRKNEFDCDNFKKLKQSANKCHTDLLTVLSKIFESILDEICHMPDVHPFIYPVDIKVNQYNFIIKNSYHLYYLRYMLH